MPPKPSAPPQQHFLQACLSNAYLCRWSRRTMSFTVSQTWQNCCLGTPALHRAMHPTGYSARSASSSSKLAAVLPGFKPGLRKTCTPSRQSGQPMRRYLSHLAASDAAIRPLAQLHVQQACIALGRVSTGLHGMVSRPVEQLRFPAQIRVCTRNHAKLVKGHKVSIDL